MTIGCQVKRVRVTGVTGSPDISRAAANASDTQLHTARSGRCSRVVVWRGAYNPNIYRKFSCCLPQTKSDVHTYRSYNDFSCPVIEVGSFERTQ
jgi:hypothetical protein